MIQDFHGKAFIGAAVIGGIFQGKWDDVGFVLGGLHDTSIKCFLYFREFGESPIDEASLDTVSVLYGLEKLKSECRAALHVVLDRAAAEDKAQVLQELKNSNKPDPLGTVNEIAVRFGISKSEVRRRKAEGTLGELQAK